MEWLRQLIEKHTKDGVLNNDELFKEINTEFPKHAVPKSEFNSLNETKKDLEGQLNTANTTIADLKKSNADNNELQGKIKKYEEDLETLKVESETKIKNLTLDTAIRLALKENKAKYEDLLLGKFDREKLVIKEDGKIEGLDEQLKSLKEGYKDLFGTVIKGNEPPAPGAGSDPSQKNPWSAEHFNLTKQGQILRENPELAAQLKAAAK